MLHRFGLFSTYMLQKHFIGNYKNLLQTETMQWFSFQQTADEKYTWDMNYNTKKRNYTIAHGIHNMVWALFILLNIDINLTKWISLSTVGFSSRLAWRIMQWFSFQQTADEKYTWDMNYNTKKRNYTIAHGIHNMVWALFILLNIDINLTKWFHTIYQMHPMVTKDCTMELQKNN